MIEGKYLCQMIHKVWALGTGSYQSHVALQYAKELRNFIDVRSTQELPDPCDTMVAAFRPNRPGVALSVVAHRSKLPEHEGLSILTHSFLTMKHRATRIELNKQRDHRKKRKEKQQQY